MSHAAEPDPITFFGFLATVLITLVFGFIRERLPHRKRTAALAKFAQQQGFRFHPKVPRAWLSRLGSFPILKHGVGDRQRGQNLMRCPTGDGEVVVLDYQYGAAKQPAREQTVAIFPKPVTAQAPPEFTLAPETWVDRAFQVLGDQDIDFEENPEFSKRYQLRGKDEAAIRAVFGEDARLLLAGTEGWSVESAGGALAVYRNNECCEPEKFPAFLSETAAIHRALVRA